MSLSARSSSALGSRDVDDGCRATGAPPTSAAAASERVDVDGAVRPAPFLAACLEPPCAASGRSRPRRHAARARAQIARRPRSSASSCSRSERPPPPGRSAPRCGARWPRSRSPTTIRNTPISAVERTCVPPHSSREKEPSPTSTIRTTSPYFSPNSAIAPSDWASSSVVVSARTGWLSRIQPLTSSSTARSSSGVSALPVGEVEAQLVRLRPQSRPGARACPSASRSAACSRCVAVWLPCVAWRARAVDAGAHRARRPSARRPRRSTHEHLIVAAAAGPRSTRARQSPSAHSI